AVRAACSASSNMTATARPFDILASPSLRFSQNVDYFPIRTLGTYNTIVIPYMLSWSLPLRSVPGNVYVRNSLTILIPDASTTMSDLYDGRLTNGGVPSGSAFATFEPNVGISWLYNGWDISIGTGFAVNTSHHYSGNTYHSASEFSADYTLTKTINRFTIGLGGSQQNQVSNDTINGAAVLQSKVANYSIGPIVGYRFRNGIDLTAFWNHSLATRNDVGGDFFDIRLVTAF
ncbi:transporter, partial [Acidocella sp.]|uniref:transporter n=1 Tax=Acidocella sp. TaxID=50710 RepID=UPI003D0449F7